MITVPTVLVVEDDVAIQRLIELTLRAEGYEVRGAENGREALDVLENWRPDVIVLDLRMPVMDGRAFRAAQLELAGAADIPVIVVTAGRDGRAVGEELNASAVVAKPFDPDDLLDAVQQCVEANSLLRP